MNQFAYWEWSEYFDVAGFNPNAPYVDDDGLVDGLPRLTLYGCSLPDNLQWCPPSQDAWCETIYRLADVLEGN